MVFLCHLELPLLALVHFAKVSNDFIIATCPLENCLEDQSVSFIVSCNVALDHILVSTAPKEMTARVFQGAQWACVGGSSPQPRRLDQEDKHLPPGIDDDLSQTAWSQNSHFTPPRITQIGAQGLLLSKVT